MLPVSSGRRLLMLVVAVLMAAIIASPAFAQTTGMVKGKVIDDKRQPVDGAKISIESKDGSNRTFSVNTNKKGEFAQIGIPPGQYKVTAEKGKLAQSYDARVRLNESTEVNFVLGASTNAPPSKEELAKANAIKTVFESGVAANNAGDYDGAIAKFNEAIGLLPSCFDCYYNIGQAYTQKKDYAKAEEAFKKAIELQPNYSEAYNGLTTIYNAQKRFDEAQAASQKAAELASAANPAGGGGGNVNTLYNQGVIAWNAGKAEDAKAKFEEALKVDANHPDSHFQLGMCFVNLGKLPEALKEFETYLTLAPNGNFATQAKAMVSTLKK